MPYSEQIAAAIALVARRDADVRAWLGETTSSRPTVTEADAAMLRGVPVCHLWQVPTGPVPSHLTATKALSHWQAGECAICGAPDRLVIDHDHLTDLVRGLLCHSCNVGEGLSDAPVFVAYRADHPARMLAVTQEYGSPWAEHYKRIPRGEELEQSNRRLAAGAVDALGDALAAWTAR